MELKCNVQVLLDKLKSSRMELKCNVQVLLDKLKSKRKRIVRLFLN